MFEPENKGDLVMGPIFQEVDNERLAECESLIVWTWEKKDQKTAIDQESVNWKQLKTLGYQEGSAGWDTKPEAPNLIPRTPMVEGEKQLSRVVFWSSHMSWNWRCGQLCAVMRVLRIKPRSSAKVARSLNCRVIPPPHTLRIINNPSLKDKEEPEKCLRAGERV